jgi:hypothetical protein
MRRAEEIMANYDEHGEPEDLPFMPEMLQFFDKRLTVLQCKLRIRIHGFLAGDLA